MARITLGHQDNINPVVPTPNETEKRPDSFYISREAYDCSRTYNARRQLVTADPIREQIEYFYEFLLGQGYYDEEILSAFDQFVESEDRGF